MAIFDRITDILKANINDMLDKAEDPVKMVKQMIADMEEQVDSATQALGQAMGSQKVAENELEAAKAKVADWDSKAKAALQAGEEAMAQQAVDAKVTAQAQLASLQQSYDAMSVQVEKLREQAKELRAKLDEARSRQNVLIARSKMADATQEAAQSISSTATDSAFAKLDKMEAEIAQKEATAQAYTELNSMDSANVKTYESMEHDAAVSTELDRMKKEMGL